MGFEEISGISFVGGLEEELIHAGSLIKARVRPVSAGQWGPSARSARVFHFKQLGAESGAEKSGISTLKRGAPKTVRMWNIGKNGTTGALFRQANRLFYGL
jgi:hypothetical protein